ncbi:ABC transporter ATP-binding protein, partial [Actinoplanes sp. NPDC051633]
LAKWLSTAPKLLIVDEPTAGLDPEERIRFRTLLSQFAGRRTVLLSTHIVDDIAQTCREVAVLAKGRLIFRGTVDELTSRAAGRVWSVVTDGPPPTEGTVVSALPHEDGMRYRIVAPTAPSTAASPVEPGLEDGYLAVTAR